MEWLIFLGIGGGLWFWFSSFSKKVDSQQEIAHKFGVLVAQCDYSHFYKETGIGISRSDSKLHLHDHGLTKTYDLESVRGWESNHQTGGQVLVPTTVAAMAANSQIHKSNKENSGLFITVKDIDHPKWKVAFPYDKTSEKELARWIEILRQTINRD